MHDLLVIADDFTGALDTGIQFTAMGVKTRVVADSAAAFSAAECADVCAQNGSVRATEIERQEKQVLSVNTDSRPLSGQEAYERVYTLAYRARNAGVSHVYKKTDSGMRGNIGPELKAVMDAFDENVLAFIPAMPASGRVTENGIQYINGVPVNESVYGKDPFEPVRFADAADIIRSQADVDVVKVPRDAYAKVSTEYLRRTILLFDAQTQEDLFAIASVLKKKGAVKLLAGCAGFATAYQTLLEPEENAAQPMMQTGGLLALTGSQNAITIKQEEYAAAHGFTRVSLTNEQKLAGIKILEEEAWLDKLYEEVCRTDRFLLDTLDIPGCESVLSYAQTQGVDLVGIRARIPQTLGAIAGAMLQRGLDRTISMTGGDTLMGFMRHMGVKELIPVCEIGKGAVLSIMNLGERQVQIISKSGGLGEDDIFLKMFEKVRD